jgi:hypothetical protein
MQAAHAAATRSEPAELAGKRGPERLVVLLNENRGPLREPLDCLVEPYSNTGTEHTPRGSKDPAGSEELCDTKACLGASVTNNSERNLGMPALCAGCWELTA